MIEHSVRLRGRFRWLRVAANGLVLAQGYFHNGITNAGLNDLLDIYFRNGSVASNWYMGLIASDPTLAAADTMSSHSGWTEDENYSESTRPEWAPAAALNQKIDNTSSVQFSMNANTTISGFFITTVNTKGGTTGVLWSTGTLDVAQALKNGETLRGFYDLTAKEG